MSYTSVCESVGHLECHMMHCMYINIHVYVFLLLVAVKFDFPNLSHVSLKDSSGVDVEADVFDELVRSAAVSFKVFTEEACGKEDRSGKKWKHPPTLYILHTFTLYIFFKKVGDPCSKVLLFIGPCI